MVAHPPPTLKATPRAAPGVVQLTTLLILISALHPDSLALATPGKLHAEGRIEALGVIRLDKDSPAQAPGLRVDLEVSQKLDPRFRWQASLVARAGGPPRDSNGGVFDLGASFQNLAPSLEIGETWLSFRASGVEIRAGLQKFYWGRLDGDRPNDLLNPRNFEDPGLDEDREAKIAVPALSADWTLPRSRHLPNASRLTAVWEPIDVPWRYPLPGERWFAPAALAPESIVVGAVPATPCPCEIDVNQQVRNSAPPRRDGGDGNYGLRLAARSSGVDWALVAYEGYDPAPNFEVPIRMLAPPALSTTDTLAIEADTELRPAYRRFTSFGGDLALEAFDWTFRGEGALQLGRPFPMSIEQVTQRLLADPVAVARLVDGETISRDAYAQRDALNWGVGADTFFGPWMPLIELTQTALLDNQIPLLVPNIDTRLALRLGRTFLDETVDAEVMALQAFEQGAGLARLRAGWTFAPGTRIEAGIVGLWGSENSLLGQYHRNSEIYARFQWSL